MNYKEKLLVWLSLFDFLTYKKREYIYNLFEDGNIFENFSACYNDLSEVITSVQFGKMLKCLSEDFVNNFVLNLKKQKTTVITKASENYPEILKNITNPPLVLFCKGNIELLSQPNKIAIVGTRRPTNYGKTITEKLARELTINHFCIVSGMADGVDTISHRACLENGGKTIAVLAGGFNNIYPSSNIGLSEKIVESGGLLLSEKSPNEKAMSYDFPVRNRIIAGLSEGVLITEAGAKSGTMHTKDYAINFGRELFVVPGNINNSLSEGCNKIIKELPSTMVLSVNDILENFNKPQYKEAKKSVQLSIDEAIVYNLLKNGEMSFDEILVNSNFDVKTLSMLLTTLNFRGIIKKLAGNTYSL